MVVILPTLMWAMILVLRFIGRSIVPSDAEETWLTFVTEEDTALERITTGLDNAPGLRCSQSTLLLGCRGLGCQGQGMGHVVNR